MQVSLQEKNWIMITKKSKQVCEGNFLSKGQAIHFYSNNSLLTLVVYWYKEYGEINVSLLASKTKCKLLIINPCHFRILCLYNWTKCQSYLDNVTRFSSANLKVQSSNSMIYEENIEKCSILQILSSSSEFSKT